MSQQLSIPAGNGLLSINLPQVANSPGGGGSPLFTGFSTIMSDVAVSPGGADIPSGAFLPPQGISLPQGLAGQMDQDSGQIKQRLLHLAEMLGHQGEAAESVKGLSKDVIAELAKALRDFAEGEIPELPDELKQKLQGSEVVSQQLQDSDEHPEQIEILPFDELQGQDSSDEEAAVQLVDINAEVDVDINSDSDAVVDAVVDTAVDAVVQVETDDETDEQVVVSLLDELDGSEYQVPQENQVQDDSVISEIDNSTEQKADSDVQQVGLTDDDEVIEPAEGNPDTETQVQLESQEEVVEEVLVDEELLAAVTTDPRRSPVAEAARQEFNADGYRNKGEYISQIARSSNQGQSSSGAAAAGAAAALASEGSDVDAELNQTNRGNQQSSNEGRPVERDIPRNTSKLDLHNNSQPETTKATQDSQQVKPANPTFAMDKFESMLAASQKLMTKAAAGAEKLGDSPFAQRLDNLSSSTNGVPQSVSQPTQVQKAVTEANNLMMPQNVKLNTPAWNNALAERAVMVAAQNTNVARIQLDPPELGSLNIRVQINQDQVSLSFTSPHANVRDAVEQSLPRLREMFAEQGLALNESSVSDQQSNGSSREEMAGEGGSGGDGYLGQSSENDTEEGAVGAREMSLVDYYA
ncbi:MAG: flagellar hook-length control protein FliK [Neptuniibacter sp.]